MGGVLYAATHGRMYRYRDGQTWTCIGDEPHGITQIHSMQVSGGKIYAGQDHAGAVRSMHRPTTRLDASTPSKPEVS
jgi:hypothetical protein